MDLGKDMPDAFKNIYNFDLLNKLASDIQQVYGEFDSNGFLRSTIDETWECRELKDRVMHISVNLGKYLPSDYEVALNVIDNVIKTYDECLSGFAGFFPTFVEIYGQDEKDWDVSMSALARYTRYASSEFAVRAFIINNEKRMMEQMYLWSKDKDEHVRRLASEGCRPQLPWGQALVSFKNDPSPIFPILEQLKVDPSAYVRKSVANNLNDISKTHPELVIKIAKDWYGENEYTDWIVKHGSRTLLKKGNQDMLALFGHDDVSSFQIDDLTIDAESISIGEDVLFSFTISAQKATKVRLEYRIDYVRPSGKRSTKMFKISEIGLKEKEVRSYKKKHSFADVSIRKHFPGTHTITLIVNGVEQGKLDFELEMRSQEEYNK